MAESTLSLKFADLQAEVGNFLGFGMGNTAPYTDAAWTSFQLTRINSCVASGLRRFFFPTTTDGSPVWDWSFLRPTATLTLPQGQQTTPLPDDFGGVEGQVNLVTPLGQLWFPVPWVNVSQIQQYYAASPNVTGRPQMFAQESLKGTLPTRGTRSQLWVYPLPDQAYTLRMQYYVLSDFLTGAMPFPMGGMEHSETILESCLAVAEERQDDQPGPHGAAFQRRLAASIASDRRHKSQTLGYNSDRSDKTVYGMRDGWWHYLDRISYMGRQY